MELNAAATSEIVFGIVKNSPIKFERIVIENQSFDDSVDHALSFMTDYSLGGNPIHDILFVRNAEQETPPTVLDGIDSHCRVSRINTAFSHWPGAKVDLLYMLRCGDYTLGRVGILVTNSVRLSTVMQSDLPNCVISPSGRVLFTLLKKLLSGLHDALLEYNGVGSRISTGRSVAPNINVAIDRVKDEIRILLESDLFNQTMIAGHQFTIKSREGQRNIIIADTRIVFSTIAVGASLPSDESVSILNIRIPNRLTMA